MYQIFKSLWRLLTLITIFALSGTADLKANERPGQISIANYDGGVMLAPVATLTPVADESMTYSGVIALDAEGSYSIGYQSTSGLVNIDGNHNINFALDTDIPGNFTGSNAYWYGQIKNIPEGEYNVTLTFADNSYGNFNIRFEEATGVQETVFYRQIGLDKGAAEAVAEVHLNSEGVYSFSILDAVASIEDGATKMFFYKSVRTTTASGKVTYSDPVYLDAATTSVPEMNPEESTEIQLTEGGAEAGTPITFVVGGTYQVVVSPDMETVTVTRLQTRLYPKAILTNCHAADEWSYFPHRHDNIRINAGTEISTLVTMSQGTAQYSYGPAEDTLLPVNPGETVVLKKGGGGKLTVDETRRYSVTFSYDINPEDDIILTVNSARPMIEWVDIVLKSSWFSESTRAPRVLHVPWDEAKQPFTGKFYVEGFGAGIYLYTNLGVYTTEQLASAGSPVTFTPGSKPADSCNMPFTPTSSSNSAEALIPVITENEDGTVNFAWETINAADPEGFNAIANEICYDGEEMDFVVLNASNEEVRREPMEVHGGSYMVKYTFNEGEKAYFSLITRTTDGAYVYERPYYTTTPVDNGNIVFATGTKGLDRFAQCYVDPAYMGANSDLPYEWEITFYFTSANSTSGKHEIRTIYQNPEAIDPELYIHVIDKETGTEIEPIKMDYKYLRLLSERLVYLTPGDKVWITDGAGNILTTTEGSDLQFVYNRNDKAVLSTQATDPSLIDGVTAYELSTLDPGSTGFATFVAPAYADDKEHACRVTVTTSGRIFFNETTFTEKMYLVFADEGNYTIKGHWEGAGNWYREYVELSMLENPGMYSTAQSKHYKWNFETAQYDEVYPSPRLEDGKLRLAVGDNFKIVDTLDAWLVPTSNAEAADPEKTGHRYGKNYGSGIHTEWSGFESGNAISIYAWGDEYYTTATTTAPVAMSEGGFLVDESLFQYDAEGNPCNDLNEFIIDLRYPANRNYTWGTASNFSGVNYYIEGDWCPVDESGEKRLKMLFHPETGLYTVTGKDVWGLMTICIPADDEDYHWAHGNYVAIEGRENITVVGEPYTLYCALSKDGVPTNLDPSDTSNKGFCVATQGSTGLHFATAEDEHTEGYPTWPLYDLVTFVFDPSTNRLWVYPGKGDGTDFTIVESTEAEVNPLYLVFVAIDQDYLLGHGAYEGTPTHCYHDILHRQGLHEEGVDHDDDHLDDDPGLVSATDVEIAKAKIEFYNNYLKVVGARKMVRTESSIDRYTSGSLEDWDLGLGDGWIDTRATNIVSDPENRQLVVSNYDTQSAYTLGGNKFTVELAENATQDALTTANNQYRVIYYFYAEKVYPRICDIFVNSVSYGACDDDPALSVQPVINVDQHSKIIGRRYMHLFDSNLSPEYNNVESTERIINTVYAPFNLSTDEDYIRLGDMLEEINLFGNMVTYNSKLFYVFDRSDTYRYSRVYRHDDRMYVVFDDINGTTQNNSDVEYDPKKPWTTTYPTYYRLEPSRDNEDNVVPNNYESVFVAEKELHDNMGQTDAEGYFMFNDNKYSSKNGLNYFFLSRKVVDVDENPLNLREILCNSYSWLPNDPGLAGRDAADAARYLTWQIPPELEGKEEVYLASNSQALVRTSYLNFINENFISEVEDMDGDLNTDDPSYENYEFTRKLGPLRAADGDDDGESDTSADYDILSPNSTTLGVINGHISDLYTDAYDEDTNSKYYKVYVTRAGGNTPVIATDGTVTFDGPVTSTDQIILVSKQSTGELESSAEVSAVEDVRIEDEVTAAEPVVTVTKNTIRVTGANETVIYTVNGLTVAASTGKDLVVTVQPGIYIVHADNKTLKIYVK